MLFSFIKMQVLIYSIKQKIHPNSFPCRFEATRRIREWEHNVNISIQCGEVSVEAYDNISTWHVPILAMTADVIQATSEECLRCGMDGYVSKPFEAEQLYREVSRFFQSASNAICRPDSC